ncbi:PH domain-containing protein [Myroides odoratus]|uniref:PH domain-containing protein n=1 Tax=Myroides odoratus TaxID=256 RepID=UPI0039AEE5CF
MSAAFTNEQIQCTELPTLDTVQFQPLHAKYKKVVLIQNALLGLFLLLLGASGFYLPLTEDKSLLLEYKLAVFVGSIILALGILILNLAGVNKKGYALREHDIIYKSGLISQKQIAIPFNRVQHVEIYEGAVLRLFGLSRIEFFTAGGSFGDLKIPGLPIDETNKIKAFVIKQVVPPAQEQPINAANDSLNTEL